MNDYITDRLRSADPELATLIDQKMPSIFERLGFTPQFGATDERLLYPQLVYVTTCRIKAPCEERANIELQDVRAKILDLFVGDRRFVGADGFKNAYTFYMQREKLRELLEGM
ncbi:hypothetical protein COY07_01260 [Candidatus Peregrinibacteria bacterium CG_4_10_14_0_2_um_filter_43_11]|nr:MAG: hypothetical protein COY07_01260 [Candidatus Peregrinibacteria bacterium CG_4_10_14_0_2_um_filter_43_11]